MINGSQTRRGGHPNASDRSADRGGLSTGGATAERRRRIATRTAPLIVVATLAFAGGMVVAVEPDAPAAQRFVDAWERGDTAAMYAELTPDAQDEYSLPHFRELYDDAATRGDPGDAQRRRRQRGRTTTR